MWISTFIAIFRIPRETGSGFSTRSITWNRVPYVSCTIKMEFNFNLITLI
jgi:hypothetical protein